MECMKCKKPLSKRGSHFVCQGECQGTFHRTCVRGLAADMKAGKIRTHCNNCEDDEDDLSDGENDHHIDNNRTLKQILKKVSDIPGLKSQLSSIKDSICMLSDKYDKILEEQDSMKQRITKAEKCMTDLSNKCVNLQKCNIALEQKLHDMDQSSRKNNIEISGVEQLPKEKPIELVKKIGVELNLPTNEIAWARRLPQRKEGKTASIIVGFRAATCGGGADGDLRGGGSSSGGESGIPPTESMDRASWLSNRRTRSSLTSDTITGGASKSKIYINEDLNKQVRELLWKTKNQLRGKYRFIWVSNGRILVKESEGENMKATWIRSEDDLKALG